MVKQRRQFWGLVIYKKVGDGCFNGLWNNNDISNQRSILNEITRKSDGFPNKLEGIYTSAWIEKTNDAVFSDLVVTKINKTEYSFKWIDQNGHLIFHGVGMEIGLESIAVAYWFSNATSLVLTPH